MKKLIPIVFLIGYSFSAHSQYCVSGGPSSTFDSDVGAFSLNGETTNINVGVSCPGTSGLEDLTGSQSADLKADSTYTLNIEFSSCASSFTNTAQVWIDFDDDNVFEQSEVIGTWSGTAPSTASVQAFSFTVPTWVCDGNKRMRISQQENGTLPLDPCASFTYGSMTDVTLAVSGGTCQVAGCTDSTAINYNPLAVTDDGFCVPIEGVNCDTPSVITSLPFMETGVNTLYYGSNYSSSDACGSNYMNGNDFIYEYTATTDECISVSLTSTSFDAGVFILDGCPDGSGTNCIEDATGNNASLNAVVSPGTYYIVVSSDPSFGGAQSIVFDIDISSTTAGAVGSSCSNPHVITGSYSESGMTTSCFGNDYNSSMGCGSFYMDGEDYVFEYTPSNDTCVSINITNADFSTGVFLLDDCPDAAGVNCIAQSTGSSSLQIYKKTLMAGTTYYIVVSTDGFPSSTSFDFDLEEGPCPVPGIQDCAGAQPLCLGIYTQDQSFEGEGEILYEFSTTNTCFGQASGGPPGEVEVNSAWYTFTVPGNGDLNFTLTPNDPTNDYDWAVFDITGPDHSCETLHEDGAVSCNWSGSSGPTGPNGQTGDQNEDPFPVVEGNTYAVVITNYSNDQDGYQLDFTASTADVYASDLNTQDQNICKGEVANLSALYTGPSFGETSYTWSPASLVENADTSNTVTKVFDEDSVIFYVDLKLGEECEARDSVIVHVRDGAPDFVVSYDSVECPVIVTIENFTSSDAVIQTWDFADGQSFVGADPMEHEYVVSGEYDLTLTTETINGCLDTAVQKVIVPNMAIPNILTPNGDGINDYLIINCLEEGWDLTVYNRWGKKVAQIFNYDNTWDGDNLVDGKYYCTLSSRQNQELVSFKAWFLISR